MPPLPDLSHLLDPEMVPDGLPQKYPVSAGSFQLVAGDGIDVQRTGDEFIVSLSREVMDEIEQAQEPDDVEQEDPLQYMGFRISYGAGAVLINTGYITCTKWDGQKWIFQEVPANQGVIEIEPPFYVYAAIPMKTYTEIGTVPNSVVDNEVTIDTDIYASTIDISTYWTGLDEEKLEELSLTPKSIFEVSTTAPEFVSWPGDGKYRFVLGFVTADEEVQQTHIGSFTLPQSFTPNINSWSLV